MGTLTGKPVVPHENNSPCATTLEQEVDDPLAARRKEYAPLYGRTIDALAAILSLHLVSSPEESHREYFLTQIVKSEQHLCLKKVLLKVATIMLEILFQRQYLTSALSQHLTTLKKSQKCINENKLAVLCLHCRQYLAQFNPDPSKQNLTLHGWQRSIMARRMLNTRSYVTTFALNMPKDTCTSHPMHTISSKLPSINWSTNRLRSSNHG